MKIVKDVIKKKYELTFLVPAIHTDAEAKKIQTEVETLIKKYKGKVLERADWGKRKLAYNIKKEGESYDSAFYYHWLCEFSASQIQDFEKFLYLNSKVIRHLLIVAAEQEDPKEEKK